MRNEVEKLIIDWLKSDNENTTYLAGQICFLLNVPKIADVAKLRTKINKHKSN